MLWMLRMMLALLPGLALAQDLRPAEEPPADFFARQYIDSRGCVFLRDDAGLWAPRLARDGSATCGYPPTLSARGLDGKPRLRALDPDAGRSHAELLEEALSQAVITNLRPGELASDPRPMETLPDRGGEPVSAGPAEALRAALSAAPALRQGMGGALQPNRRLCELLGYDGAPGAARLGADPSQGYCGSLNPADLSRLSFMRPAGDPTTGTAARVAPLPPAATAQAATVAGLGRQTVPGPVPAAKPAAAARAIVPQDKPGTRPQPAGKSHGGAGAATSAVGTIPAGARYVQLGTFGNPDNAERAARRLAGLGYPVLRGRDRVNGREVQFIMAGPFDDREAIVRALDAIRRAGYRDAFPR